MRAVRSQLVLYKAEVDGLNFKCFWVFLPAIVSKWEAVECSDCSVCFSILL